SRSGRSLSRARPARARRRRQPRACRRLFLWSSFLLAFCREDISDGIDSADIALRAQPHDDAGGALGDIGMIAIGLAAMDVGEMHLDHRKAAGLDRIQD